jgi:S1-C subfamily serine protease
MGAVIADGPGAAIVPATTLRADVDRLREGPMSGGGVLGVDVQELTPPLSAATRAASGVIVSWVDPEGPAAGTLMVGDVIEAADGKPMESPAHWRVHETRLAPGRGVMLRVRRGGELLELGVTAAPRRTIERGDALGLTMRSVPGGTQVVRVDAGSAAHRAGIEAGDLITSAGSIHQPAPGQVRAAYAEARDARLVLLAITRGSAHHVVVLER